MYLGVIFMYQLHIIEGILYLTSAPLLVARPI
jgi:hypothetical protein